METNNIEFTNNEQNEVFLDTIKTEIENIDDSEEKEEEQQQQQHTVIKQETEENTPNKNSNMNVVKEEIIEIETESESEPEIVSVENIDCYELFIDTEEEEEEPVKKKPLTCPRCPKQFVIKEYLDRHMAVHAFEKRYQCKPCKRNFSGEENFLQHALQHKLTPEERYMTKGNRICHLLEISEVKGE